MSAECSSASDTSLAVDESVILLHPPLPSVGVSKVMERERQQNDSLVNGYTSPLPSLSKRLNTSSIAECRVRLGGPV